MTASAAKRSLQKRSSRNWHDLAQPVFPEEPESSEIPDERLRLIFTCCHPALAPESRIALTLRTLCGLETDEIARAFLVPMATMAQRLVRAKRKIRDARIPYVVPEADEIAARLDSVLTVIYLVFNEGYMATRGDKLLRADLSAEAIRLARLVRGLMAPQPPAEATALLALMCCSTMRAGKPASMKPGTSSSLKNRIAVAGTTRRLTKPCPCVAEALRGEPSPYALQAALAAEHCKAARAEDTDWMEILRLYDLLERLQPSPIVSLNRAVAVAMARGPQAGLEIIDGLEARTELNNFHLLHAARADLLRRLGSREEAAKSYRRALALVTNDSERRYLERRLGEVSE